MKETTFKKVLSWFLVLTLLVGMVPTTVQAEETQTTVKNMGTTVEGTNSFGTLLAEDIQEQQVSEAGSGGYNVIGLTVEDGVATVEYDSLEEAVLVVSLYTEDGLQLLISGNTVVTPENTTAVIALEGEIPEYFMASAYLLDTYDYSPLCAAYDTPMYTKEMQELLASTADDYDPDKILNLDSDKNTNFAVYADTTKVLEYTEGVNTVISADDETATYVIGNADGNITGLQTGDVLAYAYSDKQILIVKVSTVTVDGSTATITGADLEMEEVFTHVKIENESTTSDLTVDESNLQEGVTFDGFVENGAVFAARPGDTTIGTSKSIAMTLDVKDGTDIGPVELSVKLAGSLKLDLEAEFSYYVSFDRQFLEFKTDVSTTVSITVSGKLEIAIPLVKLNFSPIPGVGIGFTPEFKVEVSAKMEVSAKWSATVGISYENGKGFQNLTTAPETEVDASVSGKIFIGLDLFPNANVLGGTVIELGLSAPVGFELSAELTGTAHDIKESDAEDIHTCENCLEMELVFKLELSVELTLLKIFSYEHKLITKEHKLGDLYYSFDHDELAWGTCPYKSYKVTVYVEDTANQNAAGIEVVAGWTEKLTEIPLGKTNRNGIVTDYLPAGTYTFMATVDGENLGKAVTVEEACKVVLNKESVNTKPSFIGTEGTNGFVDYGYVVDSGECGAEGADVNWTLYSSGLLEISGSGAMRDENCPWYEYRYEVTSVVINHGVTTIGNNIFYECCFLTSVTIPDSVTSIGESAFHKCALTNITIPDSVTSIGFAAFMDCYYLTEIQVSANNQYYSSDSHGVLFNKDKTTLIQVPHKISGSYTIPESVTTIDAYAFWYNTNLTNITIGNGVTSIEGEFQTCSNLTSITIGNSVSSIGLQQFRDCYRLTEIQVSANNQYYSSDSRGVLFNKDKTTLMLAPARCSGSYTIPESVTTIGDYAFWCTDLTSITIPNSVTSIGQSAFAKCTSLTSITIPDSVASIGNSAFTDCSSLTSITIGKGVASFGVFAGCSSLTQIQVSVNNQHYSSDSHGVLFNKNKTTLIRLPEGFSGSYVIPNSVTSIGSGAFQLCYNLTSITIPDSITTIGYSAFNACRGLISVTIPDSVTSIELFAFNNCGSLTSVSIPDSVTTIGEYAFGGCYNLTDVYYGGTASQWSEISIEGGNLDLTAATIHYDSTGMDLPGIEVYQEVSDIAAEQDLDIQTASVENEDENAPALFSVYDGEYSTEVTDQYTLKTASFTGLVPGEQYVLLALVSIEVDNILAPENLLYIDQDTAAEDGTLSFTYAQREVADKSYVMACGASNKDLSDAVITFPDMTASEETQVVHPAVVYDGKTLTEGIDYVVVGTVAYTAAGEYTCHIRGIYNYSGLVQCLYSVSGMAPGDIDGDAEISDWDAIMLNRYLASWSVEINLNAADVDGDGEVSDWDAIILERYLAGWDVSLGK